jgi:hypothetical protein
VAGIELALVLISASVALRVEDSRGVSADDQTAIMTAISEAIAERSGRDAAVDKGACKKKERCAADVAQRTQAEDVVFLRFLGVPTRIRILADRESTKFPAKKHAEIDLPRSRDGWTPALASLAESLFEAKPLPAVTETPPVGDPKTAELVSDTAAKDDGQQDRVALAPWIALGGGALALAIGSGFGLSSRGARNEALRRPHSDAENMDLEDRAIGHGLAADVMFGVALVGIGAGVVLLLTNADL